MELFELAGYKKKLAPLADRMRAETLDEFLGQKHIVGEGSLLRRAIKLDRLGSCIFWGPPGTGKTTLASIIAGATKGHFEKLNAVTSGVADIKQIVKEADERLKLYGKRTYLLLDECHRFSKTQSDSLLPAVESGTLLFIGSTTENPFTSLTPAIVSRCRVFEFKALSDSDIFFALEKALSSDKGFKNMTVKCDSGVLEHFVWAACGDLRNAFNSLELAVLSTPPNELGEIHVTLKDAEESAQQKVMSVDENLYYDMLSAFCKSLRGSDPDGALYYAERLIEGGCDPRLIGRRLIVHSSEDVGMADSTALQVATSAYFALEKIGLPEGKIPLYHAIIHVATAEKSNRVVEAIEKVSEAVRNLKDDIVPTHLKDRHYKGSETRLGKPTYIYPHDKGGYAKQQYLPDTLKNHKFYIPTENGNEKKIKKFLDFLDNLED